MSRAICSHVSMWGFYRGAGIMSSPLHCLLITDTYWSMEDKGGNPVERAVRLVGGMTKATHICRVSAPTILNWRRKGIVRYAVPAIRLAKASGIPLEDLVGYKEDS